MSNIFDLNLAVECVKNVADYNRCAVCDSLEGPRMNYVCGHTACKNCVNSASNCLFCLTPPDVSESLEAIHSDIETRRARCASELLKSCQDTFNVDVYNRSRKSKQLQIEKELFPLCIQASVKYTNRRKSFAPNFSNKENRFTILPGELTSPSKGVKMEKTNYVHQWLEKNDKLLQNKIKRQPFGDLCTNQQVLNRSSPLKRRSDIILDKVLDDENTFSSSKIKRKVSHGKKYVDTKHNLKTYMKSVEKATFGSFWDDQSKNKVEVKGTTRRQKGDESGIEVDIEPIVIEDSQSEIIDKDKLAWLAVLEAEKNEPHIQTDKSVNLECSEVVRYTNDIEKSQISINHNPNTFKSTYKVPFYKKGCFTEPCKHCDTSSSKSNENTIQSKDVSITIETNDLITTIRVSNDASRSLQPGKKKTVSVQTDVVGIIDSENVEDSEKDFDKTDEGIEKYKSKTDEYREKPKGKTNEIVNVDSEDLFTNDLRVQTNQSTNCPSVKVVKETQIDVISDSDDEINQSSIIQVSAEVHKSSEQMDYGVLSEINDTELSRRAEARPSRGLSPGSTDSSDKENYDPNRLKKTQIIKKKLEKKRK